MIEIDCFGDMCPLPLLRTIEELKKIKSGESVMVVTDHSCVEESVTNHFKGRGAKVVAEEVINGVWEITVTKP
ncbi:MAG: sulfurtransferase TusA family protein [Clostridiales bacterium]|nr:sulfurtransferase TusA family protein [Clostridiales bacterium]